MVLHKDYSVPFCVLYFHLTNIFYIIPIQKNQIMKKKQYEKPSTRVVELKQQHHLLQVSGEERGRSNVQDYDMYQYDELRTH